MFNFIPILKDKEFDQNILIRFVIEYHSCCVCFSYCHNWSKCLVV